MHARSYRSILVDNSISRRNFLKAGAVGAGLMLGTPEMWAQEAAKRTPPDRIKTNIDEVLKIPRTKHSLPGPFPGKVVHVQDDNAMVDDKPSAAVVKKMFGQGVQQLTGKEPEASFGLFFTPEDVVGIKVNPVGAGLISTRTELVQAIVDWLVAGGVAKGNIVIWDRFDYMLTDAGFTAERFPGLKIEGLQTMDEQAAGDPEGDQSRWRDPDGNHISAPNFDKDVSYWADIDGPKNLPYLNQHVFNGKHSYFGKLVTKRLTKIINVAVFKNTGNGISMATKNLGYGAICNTNRLHRPLFFDVCTEVLAFPCIRDKLVLNVTDGLRGQYDGGPMPAAQFAYEFNSLFLATDPFALDMVCHNLMVEKRKSAGVKVDEHPRYTEYLRYAERLGLGVADPTKINTLKT
jgi:hypothetical protein